MRTRYRLAVAALSAAALTTVAPLTARPASGTCDAPILASGSYYDINVDVAGMSRPTVTGMNERRDIVGYLHDVSSYHETGFVLSRGDLTAIAVPGAERTLPSDINSSGTVVGTYIDASGRHAFSWRAGRFTLYQAAPSTFDLAFASVNASGAIAGSYRYRLSQDELASRGFVLRRASMMEIPLDRHSVFPVSINERGDLLLSAYSDEPRPGRGEYLLSTARGIRAVAGCPHLNGFEGQLRSVTNDGRLVGREGPYAQFVGIVYSEHGVITYEYPGAKSTELVDVISNGQAIGHAWVGDTQQPFLFVPHGG
jgi:hypothetical protein